MQIVAKFLLQKPDVLIRKKDHLIVFCNDCKCDLSKFPLIFKKT